MDAQLSYPSAEIHLLRFDCKEPTEYSGYLWNNADDCKSVGRFGHYLEEVWSRGNQGSKEVPEPDVVPDVRFEAIDAVGSDDEPEFEGSKAARQRDAPVSKVDHFARVRGVVAEICWRDREGIDQVVAVLDEAASMTEVKSCLVELSTQWWNIHCINVCQKPFGHAHTEAVELPKILGKMLILLAH